MGLERRAPNSLEDLERGRHFAHAVTGQKGVRLFAHSAVSPPSQRNVRHCLVIVSTNILYDHPRNSSQSPYDHNSLPSGRNVHRR
jgi:hypothetical protein